jgi:hypothetical protein
MTDLSLGIMSAAKDQEYLQRSVRKYCTPLDRNILEALYQHMFVGFQGQFVSMSDHDIDSLDLPPERPAAQASHSLERLLPRSRSFARSTTMRAARSENRTTSFSTRRRLTTTYSEP